MKNVAVVGASPKVERYSNKAIRFLEERGHNPIPVNGAYDEILGKKCWSTLSEIAEQIDTVTIYVGATRQDVLIDEIIRLSPKRAIFNPGTENPEVYDRIKEAGIEVLEACTLVLLRTEQF